MLLSPTSPKDVIMQMAAVKFSPPYGMSDLKGKQIMCPSFHNQQTS
jgi:hypothetical protein